MITSADNPKVKQARSLLSRRGRQDAGSCLAEGVRLIEDAVRAGVSPALVLFVAAARQTSRTVQLLDNLRANGTPLIELSPSLFGTVSDTVTSQGVIAVVPIRTAPPSGRQDFVLVLDQMRDPGNVGTVLRSAEAAGVGVVLLTPGCVDPWSPNARRAGMGAQFRLPLVTDVGPDQLAYWAAKCPLWLADAAGALEYDQLDWTRPCAFAIGGETTGFGSVTESLAAGSVRIPMQGAADSLNAAMAATVVLFEVARQRRHQCGS